MNKVILSGHLTADPELSQTTSGKKVVSACIGVNRERKEADGTYGTDFINFVAWEATAEYLARYARKGDRVELCGRWQVRQYTDRNGNKRIVNEVQVESLSAFPKQNREPQYSEPQTPNFSEIKDDDLPF